jgi:uncharacterized protein (DUF58 family)
MLTSELLKEIKTIELRAKHLATSALAGEYASVFRGQGIEFDEIREYVVGDDVRAIDWNVTAKMSQPFVKIFREDRELTIMLLIDISRSQYFGTQAKTKRQITAELAAILAFLASQNNDKIGVILFSSKIEKFIPPKKGKGHVWHIIKNILSYEPQEKGTDLSQALRFLLKIQKRRSLCFVISDFICSDYEKDMVMVRKNHDLVAAITQDPHEKALPDAGCVLLQSLETGEVTAVDTRDPRFQAEMHQQNRRRTEDLHRFLAKSHIDSLNLNTKGRAATELMRLIRRREKQHA